MARTILESGTASSDGEVYYNHIMLMAKTLGTGETVAIEVADSKDDSLPMRHGNRPVLS